MCAALLGVASRVVQQVGEYLRHAHFVGVQDDLRLGQLDDEFLVSLVEHRPYEQQRLLDHNAQIDRRKAQIELAGGDPRDVEKVVRQPDHVAHLPIHAFAQPMHLGIDPGGLGQVPPQHLEAGHERRKRITQFVAEHGEELVLAPVLLEHLLDLLLHRLGLPCIPFALDRLLVFALLVLAQPHRLPRDLGRALLQLDEHARPWRARLRAQTA